MHFKILPNLMALALIAGCDSSTAKLPPRYFPMAAVANAPQAAGPVESESAPFRQQHWLVPGAAGLLTATLYRPEGPGPFPLIMLTPDGPADRVAANRMSDPLKPAARWFAGHGYAAIVIVPRPLQPNALTQDKPLPSDVTIEHVADDLDAAYGYLRVQSFVDAGRIVLAGQGTGGFAAMALSARQPTGVMAAINFSGQPTPAVAPVAVPAANAPAAGAADDEVDLLTDNAAPVKLEPGAVKEPAAMKVATPKSVALVNDPVLAGMLQRYGSATHRPELWLYALTDAAEARRMLTSFNHAGSAPGRLVELPSVAGTSGPIADQPSLWGDEVARFIDGLRATRS
jgi:dienelactone hydrolase